MSEPPHCDVTSTARQPRDPALDGLRALAILLVYLFNFGQGFPSPHGVIRLLDYLSQTGWTGVTLFFVLSGFLITGELWDSLHPMRLPHWLGNFYARRALRIFPLYYVSIFLCAVISLAWAGRFVELLALPYTALFLQDIPGFATWATWGWITLPLYHLWSVAVEIHFYLLWPLLLAFAKNHRSALQICFWTFCISASFRIVFWGFAPFPRAIASHDYDLFPLTHAGSFAVGAALALALREENLWRKLEREATVIVTIMLAIYVTTSLSCGSFLLLWHRQFVLSLPAISLAVGALIVLALRPGPFRSILSFAPLRGLGRISYGVYVFHILLTPFLIRIAEHFSHEAEGATHYMIWRLFIGFPVSVIAAGLSWYFLEEPFLYLRKFFPLRNPLPQR